MHACISVCMVVSMRACSLFVRLCMYYAETRKCVHSRIDTSCVFIVCTFILAFKIISGLYAGKNRRSRSKMSYVSRGSDIGIMPV